MTDIKTVTLQELQDSIKALELRVKELEKGNNKAEKKNKTPAPVGEDTETLLVDLKQAKESGDKKLAFKVRRQLRKAGYSLRDNNGK